MDLTLQDDMTDIFLDVGFEETVEYTLSGGVAKSIKAIVYRDGAKEIESRSERSHNPSRSYDLAIDVSTDATKGVGTVTVNVDTVKLYKAIGDTLQRTFTIGGIIQNDVGAVRLGLK